VRKIISILLTLGVVLGLMVSAAPVAADVTQPQVVVDPNCACVNAAYNITFNVSASLTEGVHEVCIEFPAGTTVPTSYKTGDILIDGMAVFGSEVTVTGTKVCFLVPKDFVPPADNPILVQFLKKADIVNPCTPGYYKLEVSTSREPDATPVLSGKYLIIPCESSYTFTWDSSETYPGIAPGFVPPFKVCGQNSSVVDGAVYNATGDFWYNAFNVTFGPVAPAGCYPPCSDVIISMSLTASPQFPCADVDPVSTVHMILDGVAYDLTYDTCDPLIQAYGPTEYEILTIDPLLKDSSYNFGGLIHFDTVGEYTICFTAVCPAGVGDPCAGGAGEDTVLVEKCFDFDVHQWKDVGKITLDEKWNLISLPLVPFDTDIDTLLGSLDPEALDADLVDDLVSIWHYDRCTDDWAVWGNGQSSLTDMVDGESYWVRMTYPNAGNMPYTWYVWGTARNMPPEAPSSYAVCAGWNMFGFTSLTDQDMDSYLWNYAAATTKPLVYGWDNTGDWTTSGWEIHLFGNADIDMVSGQGFWGNFPAAGAIIP